MFSPIELKKEKISIKRENLEMGIYIVRPKEKGHLSPTLLLLQEAFGVNDHIQDVCHRFARQGYIVVSPDLYYRKGDWKDIPYHDKEQRVEGIKSITEEQVMKDLEATLDFISKIEGADKDNVGVIGYCLGGKLSYLVASLFPDRVQCSAVYYGGGIPKKNEQFPVAPLERTKNMKAPLIGFFGGQDPNIPREDVERIDRELDENGVVHQIHYYPNADHGFHNNARDRFHLESATDAWHRTLNWFEKYLK